LPSSVIRYSTLIDSPRDREDLLIDTTEICGLAADAGCTDEKVSKNVANAEINAISFRDMLVLLFGTNKLAGASCASSRNKGIRQP